MAKQVEELQNEIKLLKNEIKESLIDIREYLLTTPQNPFPVDPNTGEARLAQRADAPTPSPANANNPPPPPPLTVSQPVFMGTPQPPVVQQPPPMMPNYGMGGVPNVMPGPGAMPTTIQGPTIVAPPTPEVSSPNSSDQHPEPASKDSEPDEPVAEQKAERPSREVAGSKKYQRPTRDGAAAKVYQRPIREEAGATNRPDGPSPTSRARRPIPRPDNGTRKNMNGKSLLTEYEEDTEYEFADEVSAQEPEAEYSQDEEHTQEATYPMPPSGPDPLTVVKLASWTEDAVRKVGRDRLMGILDLYEATGGLSTPMKAALIRLAGLALDPDDRAEASLSECMWVFLDLDNLMARTRAARNG